MTEDTNRGAAAGHPNSEKHIPEDGGQPRWKWAHRMEFLFAAAGQMFPFSYFFSFPVRCFMHGGVAYLIPYFLTMYFCGFPLFFLETALGQYTSEGAVTAWRKICPMFEGLGMAAQISLFFCNINYIMLAAWAFFYICNSFQSPLPWSSCANSWNTDTCHMLTDQPDSDWSFLYNDTSLDSMVNYTNYEDDFMRRNTPEKEYWTNRVLRMADDMSDIVPHWDLALCLLFVWILCYFCICWGIKSVGKVVYFTTTFPFVLLFILFLRAVTLPGVSAGLAYYLSPDFRRIANPAPWIEAVEAGLFNLALCQGVLTSLGSYNKYNNDCYRDSMILCGLSAVVGLFAGCVVFSLYGYTAHVWGVEIAEVVSFGLGGAFLGIPAAIKRLPVPSFWALLYFSMILILTLNCQLVHMESMATAIADMFPRHLRKTPNRLFLAVVLVVICFLLGLPLVSGSGYYLFVMIDFYGSTSVTIIALCEVIVIGWVYGADRFYDNIEDMIGYRPFPVLKYCWMFILPLMLTLALLHTLAQSRFFSINDYVPGVELTIIGGGLIIAVLIWIPVYILVALNRNADSMAKPSKDLHQAQPHKPILTLCKRVIFKAQGPPPGRGEEEGHEKMMMEDHSRV